MKFAAAYVLLVAGVTLAGTMLGLLFGGIGVGTAWVSVASGVTFAAWAVRRVGEPEPAPYNGWSWILAGLFAWFAFRSFGWAAFQVGDELRVLSPYNRGDFSLHLSLIHHFSSGARFWPDHPMWHEGWLSYPAGMNLFHGLLDLIGWPAPGSLAAVAWVASGATFLALRKWGGDFTVAAFLFSGGLAGFLFFQSGELRDYQYEMDWKNIPLAMFTTQRGLLYAIPAGLLLLVQWRCRMGKKAPPLPFWMEVFLYSTLPLFHVHTFLFLSLSLAIWFAMTRDAFWLKLVGWAVVPGALLMFLVTGGFSGASSLHILPGWLQGDQKFLIYWLVQFGLFLPLTLGLVIDLARRERRISATTLLAVSAAGLFLVSCVVMFAVWPWDNTKMFLWSYLILMPLIWDRLIRPLQVPWRVAACFLLFFSGFLSLVGGLGPGQPGHKIASVSEMAAVDRHLEEVDPNARFAAYPTYNHPLLLTGRKVVMGYDGHLYSHGIDYHASRQALERLMEGGPDWREAAYELDADYIFWGRLEEHYYPDSLRPWAQPEWRVASGRWGEVYILR